MTDRIGRAALVGCSDPLPEKRREDVEKLKMILESEGLEVHTSPFLFEPEALRDPAAFGRRKAEELNGFFRDTETAWIFDLSGGDIANTVLPCLDYDAIRGSEALLCGYSDLTAVLNAVVAKTGRCAVNYQARNAAGGAFGGGETAGGAFGVGETVGAAFGGREGSSGGERYFREKVLRRNFAEADLEARFLRGDAMRGRVIGGNIRCFLKLAGTPYFPDPEGAILLLESRSAKAPQLTALLTQMGQMGLWEKVSGVLLGTFSAMEKEEPGSAGRYVLDLVPPHIPVAETPYIGHGRDARAIVLGKEAAFGR